MTKKNSIIDEALINNMGNFELRKVAFRHDVISTTAVSESRLWDCVLMGDRNVKIDMLVDLNFDEEELNKLRK